jgi:hypothetical protein
MSAARRGMRPARVPTPVAAPATGVRRNGAEKHNGNHATDDPFGHTPLISLIRLFAVSRTCWLSPRRFTRLEEGCTPWRVETARRWAAPVTLKHMRLAPMLVLATVFLQHPSPGTPTDPTILKAGLGGCSADFSVKDSDGKPVYDATIHVRVRYGMWGVKRADLEVGTNSDGKARIEGLPDKAKPMAYDVQKRAQKATAEQDVSDHCHETYDITLK